MKKILISLGKHKTRYSMFKTYLKMTELDLTNLLNCLYCFLCCHQIIKYPKNFSILNNVTTSPSLDRWLIVPFFFFHSLVSPAEKDQLRSSHYFSGGQPVCSVYGRINYGSKS